MKRKLLLLCNPGTPQINYVQHVTEVLNRYKAFFQSAVGGNWRNDALLDEIDEMPIGLDENAQISWLAFKLADYAKNYDYSLIVFVGHGASCPASDLIQLSGGGIVPVKDLCDDITQDKSLKRTVIIDACRSAIGAQSHDLLTEGRAFSGAGQIECDWCGKYYNELISDSQPHVELIQSTQHNCYAYVTQNGTVFSDSFFDVMRNNTPQWNALAMGMKDGRYNKNVKDIFDLVDDKMIATGQKPQYSRIGSTGNFPLYAVWRAVDRSSQFNDSGVIEVL